MKIYTKQGDKGTTSLIGGRRIGKQYLQVEAYGQIDELNSVLGLVSCGLKDEKLHGEIEKIQRNLFKIGGFYAFDFESGKDFSLPFIEENDIAELETLIDRLDETLPPLNDFILPGGTPASAQTHVARTVCRRAERALLRFETPKKEAKRTERALAYLNRLADFLFVLARYLN